MFICVYFFHQGFTLCYRISPFQGFHVISMPALKGRNIIAMGVAHQKIKSSKNKIIKK